MALSLRLRRALTLSSSVLKDRRFSSISSSPPLLSPSKPRAPLIGNPSPRPHFLIQARSFRSSPVSFNRRFNDEKEIGPDDILFEGCDYNHWLITIDFPRDPETAPTRDQMIDTYVQTAAQVFGSVEEAKKRIYACSTTTYHGFQCICDEATSEKFRGLPGVVFILPDSYIDPVNKEYGGDKYENGVITPRPPPIAYGRQGRYGDRNRNYDQPRYNRPGSTQEGRSYGPPQQDGRNYSPPPQDGRGYAPPPQDGRNYSPPPQDGRGFAPPSQDGRGFGPPPQDGRGFGPPPQDGRGFGPPRQDGRGFGPPPQDGRGFGLPPQDGRGFGPPPQDGRGFGLPPQDGRGFGPPSQDWRGSGPPPQDGRGFGPPSQDGRGSGPPSQDGRGFGPPSQDGRGFGAPSQDRRGSAQGEQRDQMPPYQSGFHQGQPGNLSPQGNLSQGPAYAGDSRQGPGFDQGPSSNGPVEGQWQAKY